jgi:hypothetical protein
LIAIAVCGLILKTAVLVFQSVRDQFPYGIFHLLTHLTKFGWWRWFQTPGKSFATGYDARIS